MNECDLILKGGVTSGVAYPGAISKLAKDYRFFNIGGTSAGAIAAVLTAAAEYRRQSKPESPRAEDGFKALGKISTTLGEDLESLFQPLPVLRPLYKTLLAVAGSSKDLRIRTVLFSLIKAFLIPLVLSALPGVLIFFNGEGIWACIAGLLLAIMIPAILLAMNVLRLVFKELPANDFGLCTGLSTREGKQQGKMAFTDWMHHQIELIAGERSGEGPLTIGDLKRFHITVASMTTDLSSRRPWQLPLRAGVHYFSKAEFAKLFPEDVLQWMLEGQESVSNTQADEHADKLVNNPAHKALTQTPTDLYRLPDGDQMPLIVLARLSLSFPGLVSAVPLYRRDDELLGYTPETAPFRRCLFSDGGISSNFPVHLFDNFLPKRPTFGIGFAAYEIKRHGTDEKDRVHLPKQPPNPAGGAVYAITSVSGFLGAIVNTAKDWQDTMQSRLSGYSERIVEIRLDSDVEGGLNVGMDEPTIEKLKGYGELAAERIQDEFKFDQHRLNRAKVMFPALAKAVNRMAETYEKNGQANTNYEELLRTHPDSPFSNPQVWKDNNLAKFIQAITDLKSGPTTWPVQNEDESQSVPDSQDADLRIVASADTSGVQG